MGIVGTVRIMGNRWGVMGWQFGFACRNGDGRQSAEPPKKLLDDHCGTQAEMVDASLGIMGILRIVRIMGKCWGRHCIATWVCRGCSGEGVTVLPLR